MENKKNYSIGEVVSQLDTQTIFSMLSVIGVFVISFIGNKIRNKSKYKLYKKLSITDTTFITTSPKYFNLNSNLEISDEIDEEFIHAVIHFDETIRHFMPHYDLTNFYNNVKTLKIGTDKLNKKNLFLLPKFIIEGCYSTTDNYILLNEDYNLITLYHELFHVSNNIIDENKKEFGGFEQQYKEDVIGVSLNEGYTELLNKRYFCTSDDLSKTSYLLEVNIVSLLEDIVGKEKMETLYSKSDFYGLIEYLKQYKSEEEIFKFINDSDCLLDYNKKKFDINSNEIQQIIDDIIIFLSECYTLKLKGDLENKQISNDIFCEELMNFLKKVKKNPLVVFRLTTVEAIKSNYKVAINSVNNILKGQYQIKIVTNR